METREVKSVEEVRKTTREVVISTYSCLASVISNITEVREGRVVLKVCP